MAMAGLRQLLLLGAGGFAREAAEAVRAVNAVHSTWQLLGYLDDDPGKAGKTLGRLPVLGRLDALSEYRAAQVVLCPGRPDNYAIRPKLVERLGLDEERFATIVHPTATAGLSCEVGAGSVLLAHVDLTADVVVGRHVVVMPQVVLTHDVRVGDFATLASGARLGGGCHVGHGAYVASGACLREGIKVGDRAMVGMGAIVTRDVPADRLWYGAPARDRGPAPSPAGAHPASFAAGARPGSPATPQSAPSVSALAL
jgi:sugar O-acyltransferase (sialic acid O-acetyltransferase NeuD family)